MSEVLDLDYLFDKYTASVKEASGLRNSLILTKRELSKLRQEMNELEATNVALMDRLQDKNNLHAKVARQRAETIGGLNEALAKAQALLDAGKYYNGQKELVG